MSAPDHIPKPPPGVPGGPPALSNTRWLGLAVLIGLLALLAAAGGFAALIVVGAIVAMIFLHELGHYLTAKRAGMKVTEFFLGFGPRLWSFRRGETEYGIKAIPAGAYVRIIGMNNLEEVAPEDESRAYRNKSYMQKLSVAVAGSAMHFLIAIVLLFVLFAGIGFSGVTEEPDWRVGAITEESAAAAMGIQLGDEIVSVNGESVDEWSELGEAVTVLGNESATIVVERGDETVVLTGIIGVNEDDPTRGFLGVGREFVDSERLGPPEALGRSVSDFGRTVKLSVVGIGQLFTPSGLGDFFGQVFEGDSDTASDSTETAPAATTSAEDSSSGDEGRVISIVGAARIGTDLARNNLAGVLVLFVALNVFIGVFNLIPLLPLDGGHVAIATYERIRSRNGVRYEADVTRLIPVIYAVLFVLISVGVVALYLDLVDPISL